jgi:hypothetical protein
LPALERTPDAVSMHALQSLFGFDTTVDEHPIDSAVRAESGGLLVTEGFAQRLRTAHVDLVPEATWTEWKDNAAVTQASVGKEEPADASGDRQDTAWRRWRVTVRSQGIGGWSGRQLHRTVELVLQRGAADEGGGWTDSGRSDGRPGSGPAVPT